MTAILRVAWPCGMVKQMRQRRRSDEITLRYCSGCSITTRHARTENTETCLRCGTVKTHVRIIRNPQR